MIIFSENESQRCAYLKLFLYVIVYIDQAHFVIFNFIQFIDVWSIWENAIHSSCHRLFHRFLSHTLSMQSPNRTLTVPPISLSPPSCLTPLFIVRPYCLFCRPSLNNTTITCERSCPPLSRPLLSRRKRVIRIIKVSPTIFSFRYVFHR